MQYGNLLPGSSNKFSYQQKTHLLSLSGVEKAKITVNSIVIAGHYKAITLCIYGVPVDPLTPSAEYLIPAATPASPPSNRRPSTSVVPPKPPEKKRRVSEARSPSPPPSPTRSPSHQRAPSPSPPPQQQQQHWRRSLSPSTPTLNRSPSETPEQAKEVLEAEAAAIVKNHFLAVANGDVDQILKDLMDLDDELNFAEKDMSLASAAAETFEGEEQQDWDQELADPSSVVLHLLRAATDPETLEDKQASGIEVSLRQEVDNLTSLLDMGMAEVHLSQIRVEPDPPAEWQALLDFVEKDLGELKQDEVTELAESIPVAVAFALAAEKPEELRSLVDRIMQMLKPASVKEDAVSENHLMMEVDETAQPADAGPEGESTPVSQGKHKRSRSEAERLVFTLPNILSGLCLAEVACLSDSTVAILFVQAGGVEAVARLASLPFATSTLTLQALGTLSTCLSSPVIMERFCRLEQVSPADLQRRRTMVFAASEETTEGPPAASGSQKVAEDELVSGAEDPHAGYQRVFSLLATQAPGKKVGFLLAHIARKTEAYLHLCRLQTKVGLLAEAFVKDGLLPGEEVPANILASLKALVALMAEMQASASSPSSTAIKVPDFFRFAGARNFLASLSFLLCRFAARTGATFSLVRDILVLLLKLPRGCLFLSCHGASTTSLITVLVGMDPATTRPSVVATAQTILFADHISQLQHPLSPPQLAALLSFSVNAVCSVADILLQVNDQAITDEEVMGALRQLGFLVTVEIGREAVVQAVEDMGALNALLFLGERCQFDAGYMRLYANVVGSLLQSRSPLLRVLMTETSLSWRLAELLKTYEPTALRPIVLYLEQLEDLPLNERSSWLKEEPQRRAGRLVDLIVQQSTAFDIAVKASLPQSTDADKAKDVEPPTSTATAPNPPAPSSTPNSAAPAMGLPLAAAPLTPEQKKKTEAEMTRAVACFGQTARILLHLAGGDSPLETQYATLQALAAGKLVTSLTLFCSSMASLLSRMGFVLEVSAQNFIRRNHFLTHAEPILLLAHLVLDKVIGASASRREFRFPTFLPSIFSLLDAVISLNSDIPIAVSLRAILRNVIGLFFTQSRVAGENYAPRFFPDLLPSLASAPSATSQSPMEQILSFILESPKNFLLGLQVLSSVLPKPFPALFEDFRGVDHATFLPYPFNSVPEAGKVLSVSHPFSRQWLASQFHTCLSLLEQILRVLVATSFEPILVQLAKVSVQLVDLGDPKLTEKVLGTLGGNLLDLSATLFNLNFNQPVSLPSVTSSTSITPALPPKDGHSQLYLQLSTSPLATSEESFEPAPSSSQGDRQMTRQPSLSSTQAPSQAKRTASRNQHELQTVIILDAIASTMRGRAAILSYFEIILVPLLRLLEHPPPTQHKNFHPHATKLLHALVCAWNSPLPETTPGLLFPTTILVPTALALLAAGQSLSLEELQRGESLAVLHLLSQQPQAWSLLLQSPELRRAVIKVTRDLCLPPPTEDGISSFQTIILVIFSGNYWLQTPYTSAQLKGIMEGTQSFLTAFLARRTDAAEDLTLGAIPSNGFVKSPEGILDMARTTAASLEEGLILLRQKEAEAEEGEEVPSEEIPLDQLGHLDVPAEEQASGRPSPAEHFAGLCGDLHTLLPAAMAEHRKVATSQALRVQFQVGARRKLAFTESDLVALIRHTCDGFSIEKVLQSGFHAATEQRDVVIAEESTKGFDRSGFFQKKSTAPKHRTVRKNLSRMPSRHVDDFEGDAQPPSGSTSQTSFAGSSFGGNSNLRSGKTPGAGKYANMSLINTQRFSRSRGSNSVSGAGGGGGSGGNYYQDDGAPAHRDDYNYDYGTADYYGGEGLARRYPNDVMDYDPMDYDRYGDSRMDYHRPILDNHRPYYPMADYPAPPSPPSSSVRRAAVRDARDRPIIRDYRDGGYAGTPFHRTKITDSR